MWNMLKKDFLTISRDRSEVLVLLVMPFVLIAILGFALGGINQENQGIAEIPIALVMSQDFDQELQDFEQRLEDEGFPREMINQVIESAEAIDPAIMLKNLLLAPELEGAIATETGYQSTEAQQALEDDQIAAIITIPEQFSYQTLIAIYLDEEPNASIEVKVQDYEQIRSDVIESVVTNFVDQYNFETSIALATEGEAVETALNNEAFGETTYLSTRDPVSAFQYYTIGMAVMFALYVAATVSSNAFKEKETHVFARLMVTGEKPIRYLISKAVAATVLTALQLAILFILSGLLFQTFANQDLSFWLGVSVITLSFAVTVGSVATLLTAIALQFNNDAISAAFSGGIVTIFAFLGGSFTPVEQISPVIRMLGNWTPNGAVMTAYLQTIQGLSFGAVMPMIYRVLVMSIVLISVAVFIFPKRRLA
ncbi:ABC transporter permease [Amphibacillus cookii]|uniref:ABC transporter permease n=1 Tax=Amphibacillus cookii TaxID=767787 RepID=UPI00195A8A2B|nr:ABC transporter permease [Amphibacillus cookii]MBM7543098.1 ABC-2 type transport system permease protein [Amphibacillus cookii]